jgi:hypothetical protein
MAVSTYIYDTDTSRKLETRLRLGRGKIVARLGINSVVELTQRNILFLEPRLLYKLTKLILCRYICTTVVYVLYSSLLITLLHYWIYFSGMLCTETREEL